MSQPPRIAIPLDIPDVRVLHTEQTKASAYMLTVLKRRCYGLRNVRRLFQRLTLDVDHHPLNMGLLTGHPEDPPQEAARLEPVWSVT